MRCPTLAELPPPPAGKTGWPWTEETQQLPDTMPDGQLWPRISIVTPSYMQGHFIEETIRSVLLQGYPNLEYIIFDGGSKDDSVHVIQRYAGHLASWISEPDRGQSDAINKGWRSATGDIYAYINSDDVLLPGAVQRVAQAAMEHPQAGIIHGDWEWIDVRSGSLGFGRGREGNFSKLLRHGQIRYVAQPASFYRAEPLRQVGFIDESLHFSMDYDLLLRLARVSPMIYVPSPLARFRLHTNAKVSSQTSRHWEETRLVQTRYGGKYLLKPRLQHLQYRLLQVSPKPVQKAFRKWRNSVIDRMYLMAEYDSE